MVYSVAVVGTGANPEERSREGFAMGYRHANAYQRIDDCELVACADIVSENAEAFAEEYGIADEHVYEDAERMARSARPDIVSVTVPPAAHGELVTTLADVDGVSAIHCEKPMAATWQECQEMVRTCEERGVKLTINHQRRFGTPFRKAKSLLDEGAIGSLERVEFGGKNLFDAGTHQFDLCGYYTDGAAPEWVLAGIDYSEENIWFGAHNANQGLAQWRYENGVSGLAATGTGRELIGCYLRLVGSGGAIEIGVDDGPTLRVRRDGDGWEQIDTEGESIHGPLPETKPGAALRKIKETIAVTSTPDRTTHYDRAIADVVSAVREDDESELAARHALQSTELIFGAWESVRRRGRIDLPLRITDNPLESMVEAGDLEPVPAE